MYRDAPMGLSGPSPQQEPHRSGLHLLGGGSQSFLQTNSSEEGREKAASSLPGPQKRISGWKQGAGQPASRLSLLAPAVSPADALS